MLFFVASPPPLPPFIENWFLTAEKKTIITRYMKTQGGEFTLVVDNVYHWYGNV